MSSQIEAFYIKNRTVLLKRLRHRAGSPHNAEDVLQEAFCRALKYYSSFNPYTQEIGAWFNTIMNNSLTDFKRAEMTGGMYVALEEDSETYEFSYVDNDSASKIKDEIGLKSGDAKDVLHLYFEKEYKLNEIRQILGIPYRTAQTIVNRFRVDMIDKFGDDL